MPVRIDSPSVHGSHFSMENSAPASPQQPTAPLLYSSFSSEISHSIRSGSQNLQRFFAMLNCCASAPLDMDVTTVEGLANYKLAVRAWAARPLSYVQEFYERQAIAERIEHWLELGTPQETLTLSNTQLKYLPPLPSTLQSLDISNCFGINGPSKYPKTWPVGLRTLNISNNKLKKLPGNLPDTLISLDVSHCALTSLPSTLPLALREFAAVGNFIAALPAELPPLLAHLDLRSNKLTQVSSAMPANMKSLLLGDNPLRSWPSLSNALVRLDVSKSQLQALPEQLPAALNYLDISHTGVTALPESLLQAVRRPEEPFQLRLDGVNLNGTTVIQAPQIALGSVNEYGVGRVLPSLAKAVEAWYGTPDAERSQAWNHIYQKDQMDIFSNNTLALWTLLESLKGSAEHPSEVGDTDTTKPERSAMRAAFRQRVVHLLDAMRDDKELLESCLSIAHGATETCHDNVTLGFDEMEQAHLTLRAARGEFSQGKLFDMGRSRMRQSVLDEQARQKGKAMAQEATLLTGRPIEQVDETVEVVQAYRLALGEKLGFPSKVKHMRYYATAKVTEQELQAAEQTVIQAMENPGKIVGFMAQWHPWQADLERRHPKEFDRNQVKAAEKSLFDELATWQETLKNFVNNEGEFSENALEAQIQINLLNQKFMTLEDDMFREPRERLTKIYMDIA